MEWSKKWINLPGVTQISDRSATETLLHETLRYGFCLWVTRSSLLGLQSAPSWVVEMTAIDFLLVLKAEIKMAALLVPSEVVRETRFHACHLASGGMLTRWCSLAWGSITSIFTWCSPCVHVCVQIPLFMIIIILIWGLPDSSMTSSQLISSAMVLFPNRSHSGVLGFCYCCCLRLGQNSSCNSAHKPVDAPR